MWRFIGQRVQHTDGDGFSTGAGVRHSLSHALVLLAALRGRALPAEGWTSWASQPAMLQCAGLLGKPRGVPVAQKWEQIYWHA